MSDNSKASSTRSGEETQLTSTRRLRVSSIARAISDLLFRRGCKAVGRHQDRQQNHSYNLNQLLELDKRIKVFRET